MEMATAQPSSASEDGMDLLELLQSVGLGHWHSLLQDLFARYAGWLTHYWWDERFEVDLWPVEDVIKVLLAFPSDRIGDDQAFALALSQCDFLARLAKDPETGAEWDARTGSYASFRARHQCEPYWGDDPLWQPDEFARWALAQLPPREGPSTIEPPTASN